MNGGMEGWEGVDDDFFHFRTCGRIDEDGEVEKWLQARDNLLERISWKIEA